MSPFRFAAAFVFSFSLCRASAQEAAPAGTVPDTNPSIEVGGRRIVLPAPAGFVRCDGLLPEWDRLVTNFFPPSNLLLANYGSPEDAAQLKAGETPPFEHSFNVQIVRSLESKDVGERTFAGLRDDMKKELENLRSTLGEKIKQLVDDGTRKVSGEYNVDIALTISDTAFAGFFAESDTSLGFTMLMKAKEKDDAGNDKETRSVVAAIMSPVNGRLLNFYCTKPYAGDTDRQEVEKAVSAWRDAVVAANPRVAGPAAKSSIFSNTLTMAAIGGAIGGLLFAFKKLAGRGKATPA
jgi:hypothetical protein